MTHDEAPTSPVLPPPPRATAMIVIGMAGSGKSTFVSKLASHLGQRAASAAEESHATRPYLINIDPAVSTLGYAPNVDIRDTIDRPTDPTRNRMPRMKTFQRLPSDQRRARR